jgi:Na+-driven multidrug efflux pump
VKRISAITFFRMIALLVIFIGATVSLRLMFLASQNQKSVLLITLFNGWVLSPFIGLLAAIVKSGSWSAGARSTLYVLILIITLASLLSYSGTLTFGEVKPAFKFLMVPLASWILIVIVLLAARSMSRRHSINGKDH